MSTWGTNYNTDGTQNLMGMRDWGSFSAPLLDSSQLSMPNFANTFGMPSFGQSPMANAGGGLGNILGGFLDSTDTKTGIKTQGWGMPVIGAASGLMSGFLGMKQYGLQKKALAQSKKEFEMNFDAQKKSFNSQLEDRQRARVASNPDAYQSVGDYMKKNGIDNG